MADDPSVLATIDDYLLSIAEGLHAAQRELDGAPDGGAQTSYRYYLPKLDFELKMTIEMRERTTTGGGSSRPMLMLRPALGGESSTTTNTVSTVTGSFVAIPNSSAVAALRASSSLVWRTPREAAVTVELRDAAGAPKRGVEVHFNVDRDLSDAANRDAGITKPLAAETTFVDPVLTTDAEGRATSVLMIASSELAGAQVVIVLDAAAQTETIRHTVAEKK